MRRWLYKILVILAAWVAFLGLASALPLLSGMFTWEQSVRMTLNQWLPWTLLSPLIFWFTLRYPIERAGWRWRISAHLVVGIFSTVLCAWLHESAMDSHPLSSGPLGSDFDHRPPPFEKSQPQGDWDAPPSDLDQNAPPQGGPPPGRDNRQRPPLWVRAGFNVSIYLTIASLCHAFVYFRRSQQRDRRALELETQLGQARVQTLRMQLQPHFLFNTLNAISTLVQTDPLAAREMIGSLGQMLRFSLDCGSEPEVPLEKELKFLDCYLEIAQTRFGDRLQVKHDIAPETGGALVPTFILQPLVENAVRHGIEPGSMPGTIEITVRRMAEKLLISIHDTGVGLLDDSEARPACKNGIGIANTKARLQSLYPGRHRFSVSNAPTGGCLAELEIPFHTQPSTPAIHLKLA